MSLDYEWEGGGIQIARDMDDPYGRVWRGWRLSQLPGLAIISGDTGYPDPTWYDTMGTILGIDGWRPFQ